MLINIPRLIAQIQDHTIGHGLIKFIGMDITAKNLDGLLLIFFH